MAKVKKAQMGALVKKGINAAIKATTKAKPIKSLAQKVVDKKLSGGLTKVEQKIGEKAVKSSSLYQPLPRKTLAEKKLIERKAARRKEIEDSYKKNGGPVKKMQAGGVMKPAKRVGPIDPNGAWTKVQERTIAGKKAPKVPLKKDKELGATKMKMGGKISKKK